MLLVSVDALAFSPNIDSGDGDAGKSGYPCAGLESLLKSLTVLPCRCNIELTGLSKFENKKKICWQIIFSLSPIDFNQPLTEWCVDNIIGI